jgi:hypothetical protein
MLCLINSQMMPVTYLYVHMYSVNAQGMLSEYLDQSKLLPVLPRPLPDRLKESIPRVVNLLYVVKFTCMGIARCIHSI